MADDPLAVDLPSGEMPAEEDTAEVPEYLPQVRNQELKLRKKMWRWKQLKNNMKNLHKMSLCKELLICLILEIWI